MALKVIVFGFIAFEWLFSEIKFVMLLQQKIDIKIESSLHRRVLIIYMAHIRPLSQCGFCLKYGFFENLYISNSFKSFQLFKMLLPALYKP